MDATYALGKLPADHLARLLDRHAPADPRVVLGPGIGRDAAVISFGDRYLIAKTDPITFATDQIGWYAVHVNANDVACMGAEPRWFLATLLLPECLASRQMVDAIFCQIADGCGDVGATLVGGHTEITHGIDRPVIAGCMLGEVEPEKLVQPGASTPGDAIILTKGIAIEGTAIVAREIAGGHEHLDRAVVKRASGFLRDPGISVVRDARVAARAGPVHAFHDPTEGGLATGLWELAEAAGVRLEIDAELVPVYEETRTLCDAFGLDPLGLIASGALLIAVSLERAQAVVSTLAAEGIPATIIGRVTDGPAGAALRDSSREWPMPRFLRDEIARLFD